MILLKPTFAWFESVLWRRTPAWEFSSGGKCVHFEPSTILQHAAQIYESPENWYKEQTNIYHLSIGVFILELVAYLNPAKDWAYFLSMTSMSLKSKLAEPVEFMRNTTQGSDLDFWCSKCVSIAGPTVKWLAILHWIYIGRCCELWYM